MIIDTVSYKIYIRHVSIFKHKTYLLHVNDLLACVHVQQIHILSEEGRRELVPGTGIIFVSLLVELELNAGSS